MYSYSSKKFSGLYRNKELGLLAQKIFDCHIDELFSFEKTMIANKERYLDAFADFLELCN